MAARLLALGWRLPGMGLAVLAFGLATFAAGVAVNRTFVLPGSTTIYARKGGRSGSSMLVKSAFAVRCSSPGIRGGRLDLRVAGPLGPQRAAGAQGVPGISNYDHVLTSPPANWMSIEAGGSRSIDASCDSGERIISDGIENVPVGLQLESSYQLDDDSWVFEVFNPQVTAIDECDVRFAWVCANVA